MSSNIHINHSVQDFLCIVITEKSYRSREIHYEISDRSGSVQRRGNFSKDSVILRIAPMPEGWYTLVLSSGDEEIFRKEFEKTKDSGKGVIEF